MVEGELPPWKSETKCWWRGDLFASRAVDEGIRKARRAFFQFGSLGTLQGGGGGFNPDYIINTCVMSVLLYGCENWILKGTLVDKLHCFLGDEGGVGDIAGNVSRECWRSVGRSQS